MDAWDGTQCPTGGAVIEDDPDGKLGKVFRTRLNPGETAPDGKSRCELYGTVKQDGKRLDYHEGDDYFFGWRSRVSNGIFTLSSGNSGNFIQLKGDSSCGGPAVGLTMEDGNLTLRTELYGIFWVGPAMTSLTGAWHDVVLHVHFSKSASDGFVEAWLDGVQQTFQDGTKHHQVATMCPDDAYVYLKMGYYRGSHTEYPSGTHWFEYPRMGTSYDAVAPK